MEASDPVHLHGRLASKTSGTTRCFTWPLTMLPLSIALITVPVSFSWTTLVGLDLFHLVGRSSNTGFDSWANLSAKNLALNGKTRSELRVELEVWGFESGGSDFDRNFIVPYNFVVMHLCRVPLRSQPFLSDHPKIVWSQWNPLLIRFGLFVSVIVAW